MLIHVQLLVSSCTRTNKNAILIAYLTSWHNSIFGYKLKAIEAENPYKSYEQRASTQNLLVLI